MKNKGNHAYPMGLRCCYGDTSSGLGFRVQGFKPFLRVLDRMLPQIILAIPKIDTLRSTMQVLRTLWVIAIASREEWKVYGSAAVLITLIEV